MIELYIGPGIGVVTIIIVLVVLGIVISSFGMVIWSSIKRLFRRNSKSSGKE